MCEERRSLFQVVSMEGENPHPRISINPTALQFWAGLAVSLVVLGGAVWGSVSWVSGHAFDMRFEQRMRDFHDEAIPEIERLVDAKIQAHQAAAMKEYRDRMESIRGEIATLQAQSSSTQAMVWMLYQREFGLQPPEMPPPAVLDAAPGRNDTIMLVSDERTP